MLVVNSRLKKGEKKITKEQALAHVKPKIFNFETKGWNKCKKELKKIQAMMNKFSKKYGARIQVDTIKSVYIDKSRIN